MRLLRRSIRQLILVMIGLVGFGMVFGQASEPISLESCAQLRQIGDTRRPICDEINQETRGVQTLGQNVAIVNLELRGKSCGAAIRRETPAYISLAIDQSSAMAQANMDGQPRLQAVQRAAELFLDGLQLNSTPRSDRIAVLGFDESAQVISGTDDRTSSSLPAFLNNAPNLKQVVNRLSASASTTSNLAQAINQSRDLLSRLSVVSGDGEAILPFSSDDIEAIDRAVPVIIVVANRLEDSAELRNAINSSRLSLRGLRLFLVVLEDSGPVSGLIGDDLFDDIEVTNSSIGLLDVFNQLSERAQPRQAASAIEVVYELNNADYTLRQESIGQGGQVRGNQIIWPVYQRLYAGEIARFSFDVEALSIGRSSTGRLLIRYNACESSEQRTAQLDGPFVEFQQPTPTPTFTPFPTFTPTAVGFAASATPVAVMRVTSEPRMETISQAPSVFSNLCISDWTAWLPWIGALLALLLALFLLYNNLRHAYIKGLRDVLCALLKIITALYSVFLLWLFLQPVAGALCPMPESVYFWRMDGRESGIYITNENFTGGVPPQIVGLNQEGCVGCHTVSTSGGLISAVIGGVPGRLALQNFQNERLDLPNIDAVYTSFSPDGGQIVYNDTEANLHILDIATRQTRRLDLGDVSYGALMPSWSHDGQRIAYVRALRSNIYRGLWVSLTSDIYTISPQGSTPQPLLTQDQSRGLNYYPSFSPDGRWLAYTHHTSPSSTSYSAREADVWLLDLGSSTTRPISANSDVSDSWATWSSDGRRLAFNTTVRDPNFDIVIVDVADDGSTSAGQFLAGASQRGIFEHLPFWGEVAARPSLLAGFGDVLPFLLPLFILVPLMVLCMSRRQPVVAPVQPLYPVQAPTPLKPLRLQSNPIEVLWKPQPALVIGLGAAGWHVLTQLKKTLADAALGQPSANVRLLAIVSGEADKLKDDNFSGLELSADELLEWKDELSDFLAQAKSDPSLRTWYDENYQRQIPQVALNPREGFKGNRPLGRIALMANLRGQQERTGKDLWETLKAGARQVQEALRAEGKIEDTLNVLIVSDLSDDTGSAIVNDVAYLLRQLRDKSDLGLKTVNITGHLLTGRATQPRNMNDVTRPVNTQASLREVSRFQLASLASFPMQYGHSFLDGNVDRILFDEIYLHDAERDPSPLNNFPATEGMYPALADLLALWLDSAADSGDLRGWRQRMIGDSNTTQAQQKQMILGGLGIYQYRLPFADILEQITLRYARELLQRFLMGNSTEPPRLDASLATENFKSAGSSPDQIALAFLKETLGSSKLTEPWRRLLKALASNDAEAIQEELEKISPQTKDEEAWRGWLTQTLTLILNGQNDNSVDYVQKRGAKLSLAIEFLRKLAHETDGLLIHYARSLSGSAPNVGKGLERFAEISREFLQSLLILAAPLGLERKGKDESLYALLAKREALLNKRMQNAQQLRTRRLITQDAEGRDLANQWYAEHMVNSLHEALLQFNWRLSEEGASLQLSLPEGREVVFDPNNLQGFEQAILDLARHFASPLRSIETLENILKADLLSTDNISRTVEEMMSQSGVLLSIHDPRAPQRKDGLIISANENVNLEQLSRQLGNRLISSDYVKILKSSDPFTLTLTRTVDTIPLDAVKSVASDAQRYLQEVHEGKAARPTSVFESEAVAIEYERRMGEINLKPRILHPVVVTALSHRRQTEVYLIAAAGMVGIEWKLDKRGNAPVSLAFAVAPEREMKLLSEQDLGNPKFNALIDGLFQFIQQLSDDDARKMLERYEQDDGLHERLAEWDEEDGQAWRDEFNRQGDERLMEDFIVLTRLIIRRLLRG